MIFGTILKREQWWDLLASFEALVLFGECKITVCTHLGNDLRQIFHRNLVCLHRAKVRGCWDIESFVAPTTPLALGR